MYGMRQNKGCHFGEVRIITLLGTYKINRREAALMKKCIVLFVSFLLSWFVCSQWNFASGACRINNGITVPVSAATITFKDGSVRKVKGIELRYEYVYEADKQYLTPPKQRANKRDLFIGLCAPNTAGELSHSEKEVSKISLEFEAEYSYTPYQVRLSLINGKEYVVQGNPSYVTPLAPPHDFLANKSEGVAAPEVSVFRLLLLGTDVNSEKTVSAVVFDATEHHDPDIQVMSIQVEPAR